MGASEILITQDAFKGVIGALVGLAIAAAIGRTWIRYRTVSRYAFDDALLLFACICLIVSNVLAYILVPRIYLYEQLDFGEAVSLPFPITDIAKETVFTERMMIAWAASSWLAIYTTKCCFLAFFRALIDRVQPLIRYWRIVLLVTVVFGGFSLFETLIACPEISASSTSCMQGAGFTRSLIIGVVVASLDTITDLLLITIPIALLWNVRIKTRQKLGIGAFLCLSIVMIMLSIVKVAFFRTSVDSLDLIWQLFWQQVQACTAVIMVSMNAFRSIFLANRQQLGNSSSGSGVIRYIQSWFSSKKSYGFTEVQHPAALDKTKHTRTDQQKVFWSAKVLPTSSTDSTGISLQNLESGLRDESQDAETLRLQTAVTEISTVTTVWGSHAH